MRTTIRIDDRLFAQLKARAAHQGTTLGELIQDLLREALLNARREGAAEPVELTTVGGSGPRPGVDLDNTSSLLDLMDEGDEAP